MCGVILLFPLYAFMLWEQTNFFFYSRYSEVHNKTTRIIASTQVRRRTSETTGKDS